MSTWPDEAQRGSPGTPADTRGLSLHPHMTCPAHCSLSLSLSPTCARTHGYCLLLSSSASAGRHCVRILFVARDAGASSTGLDASASVVPCMRPPVSPCHRPAVRSATTSCTAQYGDINLHACRPSVRCGTDMRNHGTIQRPTWSWPSRDYYGKLPLKRLVFCNGVEDSAKRIPHASLICISISDTRVIPRAQQSKEAVKLMRRFRAWSVTSRRGTSHDDAHRHREKALSVSRSALSTIHKLGQGRRRPGTSQKIKGVFIRETENDPCVCTSAKQKTTDESIDKPPRTYTARHRSRTYTAGSPHEPSYVDHRLGTDDAHQMIRSGLPFACLRFGRATSWLRKELFFSSGNMTWCRYTLTGR